MGGKPSHSLQSNRPESGGADKDMRLEKSGILDHEKENFAEEEAEKRADAAGEDGPNASSQHEPFSVGSPRNPDPKNK